MLKLLFFLFFVFIVYKVIQFVSKALKIYANVKNQQFAQGSGQQNHQEKKTGKTTIHYKQNNQDKNSSTGQKSSDEEYIDYEEVKD